MSYRFILRLFFFILVIVSLLSCSVEFKIAKKFLSNEKKAVLILSPDIVFKSNLKDSLIINNDSLSTAEKDSLIKTTDIYLKHLNTDVIVQLSMNKLKNELTKMGFKVYDEENLDEFLSIKDSSYILKLAQVEFEEGYGERLQEDYFFGQNISHPVEVNYINVNSWFEFERKGLSEEFPVLYCSFNLSDKVSGAFEQDLNENIIYNYTTDSLSLEDFSGLPGMLGERYAEYFFDYVLNLFILESLPDDFTPTYYYHYNSRNNSVSPLLNRGDHFVEMEPW